jgi:iron(II)-dependent oxidoreductase
MPLKVFSRKKQARPAPVESTVLVQPNPRPDYQPANVEEPEPDPLQRLYQQHRFAVLIGQGDRGANQPQYARLCAQAERALEEDVALVPAGLATLSATLIDEPGAPETEVEVAPFLISIHPVTNARFQQFVDAGCYDDPDLWPEEIWPHLIELRDLTGNPGPRFWRNGRHERSLGNCPVVGVSWYEAKAYAKWVGLRLPAEPEWQMAASWRIRSEADVFRRFPWGDAMNYQRCNLWGTGLGRAAAVDDFPEGAAPNGVRQLIGNVWEWTGSELELTDAQARTILGEMPLKAIRGGAFDTYFDTQATSNFRTGQILLARTHNLGFRCALNV